MCSGGISLCSAYNFANLRESVNNADWHELEKAKLAEIKKSLRNASLGFDRLSMMVLVRWGCLQLQLLMGSACIRADCSNFKRNQMGLDAF
jgi:hypothetical protein